MNDLCRKFMTGTSVKGVPRIITSDNKVTSVLWSLATIGFFSVCLYHVSENTRQYLQYNKIVAVRKQDLRKQGLERYFPNILLCNKNPFTRNVTRYKENNAPLPKEFFDKVSSFTKCENSDKENCEADKSIHNIENLLKTARGYYQTMGMTKASVVSHQDLAIQCLIIKKKYTSTYTVPCEEEMQFNITKLVLPQYFNCYFYELNFTFSPVHAVIGFSFVIYLDNGFSLPDVLYTDHTFPRPSAGAIMSLVPKGHAPKINDESISIPTGIETNIQFAVQESRYLSRPYNERDCYNIESINVEKLDTVTSHNYTHELCFEECLRDHIATGCRCNNIDFIRGEEVPAGMGSYALEYCGTMENKTLAQVNATLHCVQRISERNYETCKESCPHPCDKIKYETVVSLSTFPDPSKIGIFYEQFIKGTYLDARLLQFRSIYEAVFQGNDKGISFQEKMDAMDMMDNNFARVVVYMTDWEITKFEEIPAISLAAFLAQLGGSLNLWAGISLVFLAEIVEFIYEVIARLILRRLAGDAEDVTLLINEGANKDLKKEEKKVTGEAYM